MAWRLIQRVRDFVNGSLSDHFSQEIIIDDHHIYLTYEGVDPLDIALYAGLGWRNEHTTRRIVVDVYGDYYEGELPRVARSFVWDHKNGRTVKPTTFTLDLIRVRTPAKIQYYKEIFRGNRAG